MDRSSGELELQVGSLNTFQPLTQIIKMGIIAFLTQTIIISDQKLMERKHF